MDRRDFLKKTLQAGTIGCGVIPIKQNTYANSIVPYNFSMDYPSKAAPIESLYDTPITSIAFGSCNKQYAFQDHWQVIARQNPDIWLWLGDNIYADYMSYEERQAAYLQLLNDPNYANFMQTIPIMGIWDDHDFAHNNAGAEYEQKDLSKELFCNFLGLSADHPIRQRLGIYHSEILGPIGKQVQIFMLDMRYFMNTGDRHFGALGELQWQWLEAELQASQADVIIVATSIHLLSNLTGYGLEGWNDFPIERQRLYQIFESLSAPVIVLSGDRHMADFSGISLSGGKPIYEVMSSGLTHHLAAPIPNNRRLGRIIDTKNFGVISIDWSRLRPNIAFEIKSTLTGETLHWFRPDFQNLDNAVWA